MATTVDLRRHCIFYAGVPPGPFADYQRTVWQWLCSLYAQDNYIGSARLDPSRWKFINYDLLGRTPTTIFRVCADFAHAVLPEGAAGEFVAALRGEPPPPSLLRPVEGRVRNLGSTCFLNAALQLVRSLRSVREVVAVLTDDGAVALSLKNSNLHIPYRLVYLVRSLPTDQAFNFAGRQEDCGEFINYLMTAVHKLASAQLRGAGDAGLSGPLQDYVDQFAPLGSSSSVCATCGRTTSGSASPSCHEPACFNITSQDHSSSQRATRSTASHPARAPEECNVQAEVDAAPEAFTSSLRNQLCSECSPITQERRRENTPRTITPTVLRFSIKRMRGQMLLAVWAGAAKIVVPLDLNVGGVEYVLRSATGFAPGHAPGTGHYIAAVRDGDSTDFSVYNDDAPVKQLHLLDRFFTFSNYDVRTRYFPTELMYERNGSGGDMESEDDKDEDDGAGSAEDDDVMGSSEDDDVMGSSDSGDKRRLFDSSVLPALLNAGWRVENGTRAADRMFFPPGVTREGGTKRVDYFDSMKQASAFFWRPTSKSIFFVRITH